MILILDTEFTTLGPEMEILSLAIVSTDGLYEFYGERNDVPAAQCSDFVREAVLPLMTAAPPVAGDFENLHLRLRAFIESLPETCTLACDSRFDFDFFDWVIGDPWPENVTSSRRIDLALFTCKPVFAWAQADYHDAGHPYHHALHDVRGLRAGYLAWERSKA